MQKRLFFFVFLTIAAVQGFAQEKVYMPFFEVISMKANYQYSTSRLLKSYLAENKRYDLILPAKPDSIYAVESTDVVRKRAQELGAPYYMIGELNRIGEMVIVSLSLYGSNDGVLVWTDKMKALNPEDLDPIMQRLARNVGTPNKAAADGDIYTVTEYDAKALKKVQSNLYYGLSIGGIPAYTNPNDFLSGLGLSATYDVRKMLIDMTGEWYWGENTSIYWASIQAYHTTKAQRSSPFIGGGVALSSTTYSGTQVLSNLAPNPQSYTDSKGGLTLMAGGGYFFNRTGNVGLRVTANAMANMYRVKVSEPGGVITGTNNVIRDYYPSVMGVLVKVQVLFQR